MAVKIRLQGLPNEVEKIARILQQALEIVDDSGNCLSRTEIQFVKRYLTAQEAEEQERSTA